MAKARYFKADGKKGRARELPEALFDGFIHEGVLHQVVKAYLSNQRQGTASGKTRSEVSGGNSKPFRQKGTGRARQGTTRAAQFTGGGLAFPPQPHGWRIKVPKKVRGLARRSALNARAEDDRVILIDPLGYETPKTKQLLGFLTDIGIEGKTLILTYGVNENLVLSARNVPGIEVMPFGEESSYDILNAANILIERPALEAWEAEHGVAATATTAEAEESSDA
jgi:large subunit ribosomal protein L4